MYEPWATAVCLGEKKFETRNWKPNFKNKKILIHAGKYKQYLKPVFMSKSPFDELPQGEDRYNLGAIIGEIRFIDAIRTEDFLWYQRSKGLGLENIQKELEYGDYSPKRFAWELIDPILFKYPIECRGGMKIWHIDLEKSSFECQVFQLVKTMQVSTNKVIKGYSEVCKYLDEVIDSNKTFKIIKL